MGQVSVCASNDKKTLYIMDSFSEHSYEMGNLLISLIDKDYDDFSLVNFEIIMRIKNFPGEIEYAILKENFKEVIHYVFDNEVKECPCISSGTPTQRYSFYIWKVNPDFEKDINLNLCTVAFPYKNAKPAFTNYTQILDDNIENIALKILESEIKFDEYYYFSSLKDLLYFELINVLKGTTTIKKCGSCGKYFVPLGRIDTKYCNRIAPNSKKTCYQIGAMKVYSEDKKKNPIYQAYNKEYKKRNTKARYDSRPKAIDEFKKWSKEARKMRDKAVNNEISIEEFNKWIKESE